ncbi:MAG: Uma2 family endonuclease [Gammaproteobacteria bacterium]|nr:Uma2 family endonuclease [Gammaproteobacteria bacterium]
MPIVRQPLHVRKPRLPAAPPQPVPVVDYPDWDSEPMTPIHRKTTNDIVTRLEDRYQHRADVYVGGDMTMYWQEGNNQRAVMPDVFVAFGPSRDQAREVWKVWEEGKLADFVLEVASKNTHRRDLTEKQAIYESLGVTEYWQHDPTGRYLPSVLLGHRLDAKRTYEPVPLETMPDGTLYGESMVLGLHLWLDEGSLRLLDPNTAEFLPTNHDKDRIIKDRDRTIEQKDREIEELKRRLADR